MTAPTFGEEPIIQPGLSFKTTQDINFSLGTDKPDPLPLEFQSYSYSCTLNVVPDPGNLDLIVIPQKRVLTLSKIEVVSPGACLQAIIPKGSGKQTIESLKSKYESQGWVYGTFNKDNSYLKDEGFFKPYVMAITRFHFSGTKLPLYMECTSSKKPQHDMRVVSWVGAEKESKWVEEVSSCNSKLMDTVSKISINNFESLFKGALQTDLTAIELEKVRKIPINFLAPPKDLNAPIQQI